MPVRSLNSSVLKWPDKTTVDRAVRSWAQESAVRHPGIIKLGYFGSYARGDWGVGSDLDLIAIMDVCSAPFERRAIEWDVTALPLPAELLVYTADEWKSLLNEGRRFARTIEREAVWIYTRATPSHEK